MHLLVAMNSRTIRAAMGTVITSYAKGIVMGDLKKFGETIIGNLEQVIVGKSQSLELVVIGLLCQGHVLIEDVPGVGKTMLARSLAKSLDCTFNRIQ